MARKLIETYSEPGDTLLDPFCGSGTMLVEATVLGRGSIGTDVDPLAVFITNVKTHSYNLGYLKRTANQLLDKTAQLQRSVSEYERLKFSDITEESLTSTVKKQELWIPQIPNLFHWFRKYVIADLALILHEIQVADFPRTHKDFLLLCFASIIRAASNADPVPVSGLEVTAHMRQLDDQGRLINPFELFRKSIYSSLKSIEVFAERRPAKAMAVARQVSAVAVSEKIRFPIDMVVTSPPYNNAVDYYRRHQLEMFWLGFTETQHKRVRLKHKYIGRPQVRVGEAAIVDETELPLATALWYKKIRAESVSRANAFKDYVASMQRVFEQLGALLSAGQPAIFVVGNSNWHGQEIPTKDLLVELAQTWFEVEEVFWYPLKNRYMSYSRHNGANIDREYVLVFRRVG